MQSDIGSGASGGVAAQAQISGIFSASASYAVGAYVVQNGLLYHCTTAHSGAWDASHFTQVTIGGELSAKVPVYGGGVNLLDNWYFIGGGQFPINQRGVTQYTNADEFIFDRWNLVSGSAVLVSGGVTLNGTIQQTREQSIGQTVVASALCSDGTMLTPTYNDSSKIFTLTASGKTIVAVKLEAGTVQTLARNVGTEANPQWALNDPPPNFQQELAKCQRYLQIIRPTAVEGGLLGAGYMDSGRGANHALFTVPLSVPMAPITSASYVGVGLMMSGVGTADISAIELFCQTENVITIRALTINDQLPYAPLVPYIIYGGYLLISAE